MSTEPPSRIPPRGTQPETKMDKEALSHKDKIEKTRSIDPDDARKKKFEKYYGEGNASAQSKEDPSGKPAPFDMAPDKKGKHEMNTPSPHFPKGTDARPAQPVPTNPVPKPFDVAEQAASASGKIPGSEKTPGIQPSSFQPSEKTPGIQPSSFQPSEKTAGAQPAPFHPARERSFPTESSEYRSVEDFVIPKKESGKGAADSLPGTSPTIPNAQKPLNGSEEVNLSAGMPKSEKFWEKMDFPPDQPLPEKSLKEGNRGEVVPNKVGKEREKSLMGKESAAPFREASEKSALSSQEEQTEKDEGRELQGAQGSIRREAPAFSFIAPTILPPNAAIPAQAATQAASAYLSPTIAPLFYQAVGSIHIMQTSGVTRTEILLNNPAFENSAFFGTTITIEKYSTAPDSFNIRLSGSQQAVSMFREHASELASAFQHGQFNFRVNRIDADYAMEKPVFRRREDGDQGGAGGGDLGERRR